MLTPACACRTEKCHLLFFNPAAATDSSRQEMKCHFSKRVTEQKISLEEAGIMKRKWWKGNKSGERGEIQRLLNSWLTEHVKKKRK